MLRRLARILPTPVRKLARGAVDSAMAFRDRRALSAAVAELRALPPGQVDDALIGRLRRAWGNEAWSGNPLYLRAVIEQTAVAADAIVECGSGLSTIIAGAVGAARGTVVWSLEQDADWRAVVADRVAKLGLADNIRVLYAPLRPYTDYVWYDLEGTNLPTEFGLALCDGPSVPDGPHKAKSRYGLIPVLHARASLPKVVLVDDIVEPRVQRFVQAWATEFGYVRGPVVEVNGNGFGLLDRPS